MFAAGRVVEVRLYDLRSDKPVEQNEWLEEAVMLLADVDAKIKSD